MARTFVSSSSQRFRNTSFTTFDGASVLTLVAWKKRTASGNIIQIGPRISTSAAFEINFYSDGNAYFLTYNGSQTFGSVASSSTAWQHAAMVYDGSQSGNSNRLKGYIDGVNQTLSFTGTIPATIATIGEMTIGYDGATADYANGSVAEIAIYNVALSAEDVASLAAGYSPLFVKPTALVHYWPMLARVSTGEEMWVGDKSLTQENSPAASDSPPIIYPPQRQRAKSIAAAGGGFHARRYYDMIGVGRHV